MQLLNDEQFGILDKVLKSYVYHDSDHVLPSQCGGVERLYNRNSELSYAQIQAKLHQYENQEIWNDAPKPLVEDALVALRLAMRRLNPQIAEVLHSEYGFRGFFKTKPSPSRLMRNRGCRFDRDLWMYEVNRAMAALYSQLRRDVGDKFEVWFVL